MTSKSITEEFENCQKLLIALGDESRQCIIIEMMKMDDCNGARVGEITERTHLSRPAVSIILQILKDAGVVKRRKEGTKIIIISMKIPKQWTDCLV